MTKNRILNAWQYSTDTVKHLLNHAAIYKKLLFQTFCTHWDFNHIRSRISSDSKSPQWRDKNESGNRFRIILFPLEYSIPSPAPRQFSPHPREISEDFFAVLHTHRLRAYSLKYSNEQVRYARGFVYIKLSQPKRRIISANLNVVIGERLFFGPATQSLSIIHPHKCLKKITRFKIN